MGVAHSPYLLLTTERSPVSVGKTKKGSIAAESSTKLQVSGSRAEGVTIRICIERGAIIVYGSYTDPNPSAAYYDFSQLLTAAQGEVMASSCSTTHVTMDDVARATEDCDQCRSSQKKKRQSEEEEDITVYITIEGVSDTENTFSLNSSVGSAFGE